MELTHLPVGTQPIVYQLGGGQQDILITGILENPALPPSSGGITTVASGGGSIGSWGIQQPTVSKPIANFTYTLYANRIIGFRNSTLGQASSYLWDFGDGSTSKTANPYHQYAQDGTYNVILHAVNAAGETTQTVAVMISTVTLKADFTFVVGGLTVYFTNASTAMGTPTWDFGDGTTSTEQNPQHAYSTAGSYQVTLSCGGYSKTQSVTAYQPTTMANEGAQGSSGSGDGQFNAPSDVAVDGNFIYIADRYNHRIQIFNKTTPYSFVNKFGSSGLGDGQFSYPYCITVDNAYIYVADSGNQRIQIFNKTAPYAFVGKFGSNGTGDGQFTVGITGICVDDNFIYAIDDGLKRVQIFNKTAPYAFVGKFGSNGTGDGQFKAPVGIDVDSSYIYVVDTGVTNPVHPIQIFNKSTYAFIEALNILSYPTTTYLQGIAVDDQNIYITKGTTDITTDGFLVYSKTSHAYLYGIGSYGSGAGQFFGPQGITTDTEHIYIVDSNNARFQVFTKENTELLIAQALFSFVPQSGDTPLTVVFTNQSTGTTPITYLWEFGDGTTSTDTNPTHIFTGAGTYTVRLTATNSVGSSVYSATIIVNEVIVNLPTTPPLAAFTASTQFGLAPLAVNFMDTSTGTPTAWSWKINGVEFATTQNASYTFMTPGSYVVSLTVSDASGWSSTTSKSIVAATDPDAPDNAPVASINASAQTGVAPLTVNFSATVSDANATYLWDFGDGSTSTSPTPTHQFIIADTYTVTLMVTNVYGSTTSTMQIIVSGISAIGQGQAYYYVIDRPNDQVIMYDFDGLLIGFFGGHGSGPGQLIDPTKLVVSRQTF